MQNKYLLLEIKTIKTSLLFRMKFIIQRGCSFDDCTSVSNLYLVALLSRWVNEVIHLLIT